MKKETFADFIGIKNKDFAKLNEKFNEILKKDDDHQIPSVIKSIMKRYKIKLRKEKTILSMGYMLGRFIQENEDSSNMGGVESMVDAEAFMKMLGNKPRERNN